MTRSDLIARIRTAHPHLRRGEAERVLLAIFDEIADALRHNKRVELRGFGMFTVKDRPARIGRNPRLGHEVAVPRKRALRFKSSRQLNRRLAEELPRRPAAEKDDAPDAKPV